MKNPDDDPAQLNLVAAQIATSRDNPPIVIRSLLTGLGIPLLLLQAHSTPSRRSHWHSHLDLVGGFQWPDADLHWPTGIASLLFGNYLRDVGLACRVKNIWPAQSHFTRWEKVDQFE